MSLEDTELTIGGTTFKGVYIAIMLSFATTIGGGIWAASESVSYTHLTLPTTPYV